MRKSNLVKVVLSILVSLVVIVMASQVFAANDFTDITQSLNNTSSSNNTVNNTASNNTVNSVNNTTNKTNNTSVLKTNNTSSYNNSSLPKTGIEDSVPVALVGIVLIISAIYAYKKIQDYRNI